MLRLSTCRFVGVQGRHPEASFYGDRKFGEIRYSYDKRGLLNEIVWVDKTDKVFYEDVRVFSYDKKGFVSKIESGEGDLTPSVYTIVSVDKYGNWVKRKDQDGKMTKRTITYYE